MQSPERVQQFGQSITQYFAYLRSYPPGACERIKSDLCQALYYHALLVPGYAQLRVPPSSKARNAPQVVYIHGMVKVTFHSTAYYVPMHIYVPPDYPKGAPICYIVPDQNMSIKPRHRFCDVGGLVYHPMISSWNYSYTVAQLLSELVKSFSSDLPILLLQVNTPQSRTPQITPVQEVTKQPVASSSSYRATNPTNLHNTQPPAYASAPKYQAKTNYSSSNSTVDNKEKLKKQLYERAQQLKENISKERAQLDAENYGSTDVDKELASVVHEMELKLLEGKKIQENINTIQTWMDANASKMKQGDDINDDDDKSPLEKQLEEAKAADEACDDTLYQLSNFFLKRNRASQTIDITEYLKVVRRVSRDQFMHRALVDKINKTYR